MRQFLNRVGVALLLVLALPSLMSVGDSSTAHGWPDLTPGVVVSATTRPVPCDECIGHPYRRDPWPDIERGNDCGPWWNIGCHIANWILG